MAKFIVLKYLESKRAKIVVHNLVDIFTLLRIPSVSQSDNVHEFTYQI